jgi:acetyl-CoA acetyltransferase/uncharacterized OB-fold protein
MTPTTSGPVPGESTGRLPDGRGRPEWFWSPGPDGRLRVGRCGACDRLLHPGRDLCPHCGDTGIHAAPVSGRATVVAHTVNHQRWTPELPVPYVVAVVALEEEPSVRLTTNIVGCPPGAVTTGMAVRAEFRRVGDVSLPVFSPTGDQPRDGRVAEPATAVMPPAPRSRFEDRVALSGVGRSRFGRRLDLTEDQLVLEACRAALDDAGLASSDIDGLGTFPGRFPGSGADVGIPELARMLSIDPTWQCGAHEVPGQTGVVIAAMLAVAAGLCRHVLCWTAVGTRRRPGLFPAGDSGRVSGEPQWYEPFGAVSPANWIALAASQYLTRYRVGREALGWVAVTAREHAGRNPDALYREPLDLDAYLAGRPISTPLGMFDCDVPCDGAVAVIVSAAEVATDLRQPPVRVDAVGTMITEQQSWVGGTLTHQPNLFGPAAHLWSRARVRREDVDVANLYDGFTFNVLCWLEALGFCGRGEAGDFVDGGTRIALGGALPVNPHGGQLSAGRTNGYGQLHEAVLQIRGQAGARQVPGAEVAIATSGGGIPANCMLLTRQW